MLHVCELRCALTQVSWIRVFPVHRRINRGIEHVCAKVPGPVVARIRTKTLAFLQRVGFSSSHHVATKQDGNTGIPHLQPGLGWHLIYARRLPRRSLRSPREAGHVKTACFLQTKMFGKWILGGGLVVAGGVVGSSPLVVFHLHLDKTWQGTVQPVAKLSLSWCDRKRRQFICV